MAVDPYTFEAGGGGTISFEWSPPDAPQMVAADLNTAATELENMRKVLMASRQVVAGDVRAHFDNAMGSDGAWPALSDRAPSAASVERFYAQTALPGEEGYSEFPTGTPGGPSNLTDTGAGRAVATALSSYAVEADPSGGTVSFAADPPHFMLAHNAGAPDRETHGGWYDGPNPLPQREWLWLSEEAAYTIYELFEAFVDDAAAIVTSPTGGTVLASSVGFVPVGVKGVPA